MRWFSAETTGKSYPWLGIARGRALAAAEGRQLRNVLPHLIGYRLLQIGPWAYNAAQFDAQRMLAAWVAAMPGESAADLCFDGQHLPVTSHCMDMVLLPHALERCPSPRELLREVDRVLSDRGQLVLLGFNPLHPSALARHTATGSSHPTGQHLYTARRVGDWLDLLDFDVVHATRYGAGFPYLPGDGIDWHNAGWWRMPATLSQAYLLVARKRKVTALPLRQPQKVRAGRAATAGVAVAAPCTNPNSEAA